MRNLICGHVTTQNMLNDERAFCYKCHNWKDTTRYIRAHPNYFKAWEVMISYWTP